MTTTVVFSIVLAAVFAAWYASERTLSIHTIVTTQREAFYWLTVLFTFALGTAAGDLTAERLAVGYWKSALLFGGLIAVVYFLNLKLGLNAVLAFWIAYILTRPLGASIGDYLSQPRADGGLGLGTTVTSVIFLLTILAVVIYLTSHESRPYRGATHPKRRRGAMPATGIPRPPRDEQGAATPALVAAVRERVAAGPAEFYLLVPNPDHVAFDRASPDVRDGEVMLAEALTALEQAAGGRVRQPRRSSPNAYDDIVAELASATTPRSSSRRPRATFALAPRRPPPADRRARLSTRHRRRASLGPFGPALRHEPAAIECAAEPKAERLLLTAPRCLTPPTPHEMPAAEADGGCHDAREANDAEGAEDRRGRRVRGDTPRDRSTSPRRCHRVRSTQERTPGHVVGTGKPGSHHPEAGHPACEEHGPRARDVRRTPHHGRGTAGASPSSDPHGSGAAGPRAARERSRRCHR